MSDTINHLEHKTLSHLPRFLAAWCNAVGLQPGELAQRAEQVKGRWISQKKYTPAQMKRFGSSRPHFYRLLKGQLPIELADQDMLQYLSEIFEIDVVQLFDALSDRVWPSVHLAPSDYIEAPLQDAAASGARYFFPPEQLAGCPMHHLYLELEPGGTSGLHRHFAGTEMVRLDTGDTVTLCFPSRAKTAVRWYCIRARPYSSMRHCCTRSSTTQRHRPESLSAAITILITTCRRLTVSQINHEVAKNNKGHEEE